MNFVIIGLLVVLFFAFLFVVWKTAKDWRWYNIVAVVLTMLLAMIFIFPTAGALKSRAAWHKIKETLDVRAEQALADQKTLKYGDPSGAPGVLDLAQQLAKAGIEAGRRWRGLRMANNNVQSIQLNQPPQAALPPGVAAPAAAGEFRVAASTPTGVTLTPTGPLEPAQQQRISGGQASSWSLYELLPLDAHEPFVAEGSSTSDDNLFGRIDEDLVRGLLGDNVRDAALQKYLRDGSRSTPDDPPLSRWVKIEFTKNYTLDVDSPQKSGALEGGFFDGNGRAVDSRLQRGDDGNVKFKAGDRVVVKEEAAKQLEDVEGVARLVDTYYLRPLNDYRFVLRRIRLRLTELSIRTKELNYEHEVLSAALAATVAMLTSNQQEKLKLEQDLAQTQAEAKAIREHHQQLVDDIKKTRERLVALYQDNQKREQQLRSAHGSIIRSAR